MTRKCRNPATADEELPHLSETAAGDTFPLAVRKLGHAAALVWIGEPSPRRITVVPPIICQLRAVGHRRVEMDERAASLLLAVGTARLLGRTRSY